MEQCIADTTSYAQRELLGGDSMQNPDLFKELQRVAMHIAEKIKADETFPDQLNHLVLRHNGSEFTDG